MNQTEEQDSKNESDLESEPESAARSSVKRHTKRKRKGKKQKVAALTTSSGTPPKTAKFPRHSLDKVLRIPRSILDQNAGQPCTEREAAKFVGVGFGGDFQTEVSSALKFGLMERPSSGQIALTDKARKILRPQRPEDEVEGLREAAVAAPGIGEVYQHYRGENLPDPQFFRNALADKFQVPQDKVAEFQAVFLDTMRAAKLLEEHGGKSRLLDVSQNAATPESDERLKRLGKQIAIKSTDTCFIMMPFAAPVGNYYSLIYEPAIQKAGLTPIRADADIFGTGKIVNQIWRGINTAKILVAELTGRNPNVFYELGLAHALNKPVVLVCSNENDVPFDLQHIRVIYYDVTDPFWGSKLIEKIAENILSAIKNPEEAVFKSALDAKPFNS